MNVITRKLPSPDENAVLFFRHVKKELGIPSSKQMVKLVEKVIAHVRKDLSITQILKLVNHLPGIFHLMILNHPKHQGTEEQSTFLHLDEFVESIYEEDKRTGHPVFSTEVEALNAVVIVLRRMDKYLNLFIYNILKYPIVKELQQIPLEDSVYGNS